MGEQGSFAIDLIQTIETTPLRETKGSDTQRRFSYQNTQVLRTVIDIFPKFEDFSVFCEAHDDYLIVIREEDKQRIELYQVKTKDKGTWSFKPKKITEEQKKIIANMVENIEKFKDHTVRSSMVTNAQIQSSVKIYKENEKLEFAKLSSAEKKIITQQIKALKGFAEISHIDKISYHVSDLPYERFEQTAKGCLDDFLLQNFQGSEFNLNSIYTLLMVEIKKRSEAPAQAGMMDQMKSIKKEEFSKYISIADKAKYQSIWDLVKASFTSEKIGLQDSSRINKAYRLWLASSTDYTNLDFQEFHLRFSEFGKDLLTKHVDTYQEIKVLVENEWSLNFSTSVYDVFQAIISTYVGIYD